MQPGARSTSGRLRAAASAAAIAFAALTALGAGIVTAAGPIVPDSSCATESQFKSLKGDTKAVLQVINNSDETVKSWWLDYTGKRVFYRDIAPHTSYLQPTWLTHPWVISSAAGACYRFVVMNSQQQSVTVQGELGVGETVAPLATARAASAAPPTAAPATAPPASVGTVHPTAAAPQPTSPAVTPTGSATDNGPGLPIAIAGVAAALIALLAWLAITGRLPGMSPRGPRR